MKTNSAKKPKKIIEKNKLREKLLLVTAFLLAFSIPLVLDRAPEYKVVLTDTGFKPSDITITKGTKVRWVMDGKKLKWPASDNHPLHTIYPEDGGCLGSKLDACRELKSSEEFSFVFQKIGSWGLHDHLNPQNTMIVNVTDKEKFSIIDSVTELFQKKESSVTKSKYFTKNNNYFSELQRKKVNKIVNNLNPKDTASISLDICSDLKGARFRDKQDCYSKIFTDITKKNDQKYAFRTINELQKLDRSANVCHLIAHGIGQAMFQKNPKKWQDAIGKMSPECSYGGIHGILESYISFGGKPLEKNNISLVCSKNSNWGCFHAIGHLVIVQTKNDVLKANDLCSRLSDKVGKQHCYNGVFMENMITQNLSVHGLASQERRKFFSKYLEEFEELCASQTDKDLIRACWTEIIHATSVRFKKDPEKMYEVCAKAQTNEAVIGCRMHSLAEILPAKNYDPAKLSYVCKYEFVSDPNYEERCSIALASISISNVPDKIIEVISYCDSLDSKYKESCFKAIGTSISALKSVDPEKVASLCSTVPEQNKSLCSITSDSSVDAVVNREE